MLRSKMPSAFVSLTSLLPSLCMSLAVSVLTERSLQRVQRHSSRGADRALPFFKIPSHLIPAEHRNPNKLFVIQSLSNEHSDEAANPEYCEDPSRDHMAPNVKWQRATPSQTTNPNHTNSDDYIGNATRIWCPVIPYPELK
jgi:hypothetical protein